MLEGDQLLREGKDHLALVKYLEASTLNPYHEVVFNRLAIAYSRILMLAQAMSAVQRSIRLNPSYAFARNTQGIVLLASNRNKEAVKAFRKAIQLRPLALFYVNLGNAYLRLDQLQLGKRAFQQALELDPNVFQMEDSVEVETQSQPQDPDQYYGLAKVYAEIRVKLACLEYLRKAFSAGFRDKKLLDQESAFDFLRDDEDFLSLLNTWGFQP